MISFILVYWIGNVTCVMAAQISIAIKLDLNTCVRVLTSAATIYRYIDILRYC